MKLLPNRQDFNINSTDRDLPTALFQPAENGCLAVVKLLAHRDDVKREPPGQDFR
ncbi:hypothetical protein L873DRAFT_1821619 [Choiromyces venosus 120613-1]|uniref:Uncharacterized protein n=1 Tax=Choiromyces venosus 120613-1 TaxID=1336337 RepID=A0A3N4IWB3_9PEZI|nr:hypothetical protein L873DRAFT_1821619 [Choiromyces venosus 120613-1]